MSWDAAFAADIDAAAKAGAARQPATLTEVIGAEWDAAGLSTAFGVTKPYSDAVDELGERVGALAGRPVEQLAAERPGPDLASLPPRRRGAVISAIAQSLPPEQQEGLKPYLDIDGRAREKAHAIEARAADLGSRTYGLAGSALGFAVGAARQAVDPLNLAATALTAPFGGTGGMALGAFLGREFAVNAAAQAVQEPFIQTQRADLGLEAGWSQAAQSVVSAGIGGAGIAGLLRGGAAIYRRAAGAPASPPPSMRPALGPEDLDAAARVVERDQVFDAAAADPSPEGRLQSSRATDAAAEMLERGTGGLPHTMERLSELQLSLLREDVKDVERRGAAELDRLAARELDLDRRAEALPARRERIEQLTAEIGSFREEIDARRAELPPERDAETQGRLAAIEQDLATPALSAQRRGELERERLQITSSLDQVRPEHLSLAQEVTGLERAARRREAKRDDLARKLASSTEALERARRDLAREGAVAEIRNRGRLDATASELRRALGRLAQEGYGLRLGRDEAAALAQRIIGAADAEVPGVLRTITEDFLTRPRAAETTLPRRAFALPAGVTHLGDGPHGAILDGLQDRWGEAVRLLSEAGSGDARGVLAHPDVPGRIDLVWGDARGGLRHILDKHPAVVDTLPDLLAQMRAETASANRIILASPDHRAVIRLDYDGDAKTWLMTAYDAAERRSRRAEGSTERLGPSGADTSSAPPAGRTIAQKVAGTNFDPAASAARRADVERALEAAGGDMQVTIVGPDGSETKVSARELLRQTEASGRAADELMACILKGGGA